MTLITELEQAVEEAAGAVEARAGEFYADAFAEVRRLLADLKTAESKLAAVLADDKAEILALAEKYGPEVAAFLEAELAKLAGGIQSLFRL